MGVSPFLSQSRPAKGAVSSHHPVATDQLGLFLMSTASANEMKHMTPCSRLSLLRKRESETCQPPLKAKANRVSVRLRLRLPAAQHMAQQVAGRAHPWTSAAWRSAQAAWASTLGYFKQSSRRELRKSGDDGLKRKLRGPATWQ